MADLTKLEQEVAARKAELEAAQEQMREAQRKAEQAKREAEREKEIAERKAVNEKAYQHYAKVADEIVAEVKKLGYELSYEKPDFERSFFPQFSDQWRIKFWSVGRYTRSSRGTICVRVEMGSDQPRQYKLRKDGTFNIERIAESYVEQAKRAKAEQIRRQKETNRYNTNRQLQKEVCSAVGISEYSSTVNYSKYHDNAVDLSIRIPNVGKEQAIELLTQLKSMGIELR